jgi:flagellar biosynthetic protein FliO
VPTVSRFPRSLLGGLACAALLAARPTVAAAQAQAPAAPSLAPIVMALAAVLLLIPVAVWLLKRFGAGTMAPLAGLQVVGQLPLGAGQRVVVLAAGERWLLLGVTAGSITRLGSLAKPPADAALLNAAATPANFAALLARVTCGGPTAS